MNNLSTSPERTLPLPKCGYKLTEKEREYLTCLALDRCVSHLNRATIQEGVWAAEIINARGLIGVLPIVSKIWAERAKAAKAKREKVERRQQGRALSVCKRPRIKKKYE